MGEVADAGGGVPAEAYAARLVDVNRQGGVLGLGKLRGLRLFGGRDGAGPIVGGGLSGDAVLNGLRR
jgi:hypothetical protein